MMSVLIVCAAVCCHVMTVVHVRDVRAVMHVPMISVLGNVRAELCAAMSVL